MPDELDPELQRWFAAADEPLPDTYFTDEVMARVHGAHRGLLAPGSAGAILGAILSGLASGVRAPLRLRHALLALAAAALSLWALALSP